MRNRKGLKASIAISTAILVLFVGGCPIANDNEEDAGAKAAAPFIASQPGDYQPAVGEEIFLAVEGTVSDGGALSYQWYKAASVGAAGSEIPEAAAAWYQPPTDTVGTNYYYVEVSNSNNGTRTSTRSRYATVFVLDPAEAGVPSGGYNISVDTSETAKRQFVRGFGGMINAWGAPCPDVTINDADTLFNPDKLGLNILRMIIYPEPLEDIMNGLVYTSIDNSDLFDIGKLVNRYGGMIIGCPWTPPDGYKLANGHLDPDHYMDMGNHLITWVKKMEAGMGGDNKIFAISSQNEPDDNATWCIYTPEENRDFVKQVFPAIRQAIPHVKLFPGEYTSFNSTLYAPIVDDQDALAQVDGFAGHFYGGQIGERKEWAINAGKEVWMTEHLRNTVANKSYDPTWAAVWEFASDFHTVMINDYNAYVMWYAKRFYGLIGDSEPGVTNQRNGEPQLRGYFMSHYSKYAAGKYRYDANWVGADWTSAASQPGNIRATAYADDESIALVMFNNSTTASSSDTWVNIRLPQAIKTSFAVATYNKGGPAPTNSAIADTTARMEPVPVVMSADMKTASVKLNPSTILSVKFYK
jgi:glucuronoarabinoxylan endo-1,4-beta-xylanase